jgi:hypothetical protein
VESWELKLEIGIMKLWRHGYWDVMIFD